MDFFSVARTMPLAAESISCVVVVDSGWYWKRTFYAEGCDALVDCVESIFWEELVSRGEAFVHGFANLFVRAFHCDAH